MRAYVSEGALGRVYVHAVPQEAGVMGVLQHPLLVAVQHSRKRIYPNMSKIPSTFPCKNIVHSLHNLRTFMDTLDLGSLMRSFSGASPERKATFGAV